LLAGIALAGIPDVISGFLDQPSGLVDGEVEDGVQVLNVLSLIGMGVVALGALLLLGGFARALAGGARYAPNNPWKGHTLEWATVSPPPIGNFTEPLAPVRSERPLLDPVVTDGDAVEPASTGGAS